MTMPRPRGIGISLRDAYQLIPARRPDWQFLFYHQRPPDGLRPSEQPWRHTNVQLRQIEMPGDRFDAWFQLRLPLAARRDRLDLLHFPASVAPAWCPVPYVATVHDIIPLKVSGELSPTRTQAYRRGVQRAVRGAVHIITISDATRDDLHREFNVPFDRMTTILWPPDLRMVTAMQQPCTAERTRQLREKYDLAERWLLTFSGGGRRKNARGILDAFARVEPQVRRGVQVVFVGCEPASYRDELAADAERLGVAGNCRILGYLPDEDIPALLRTACGLLIPSRYEGFGWPILDAFVCGVPVLTSNVSSMPEVAGDAAVYCDPQDTPSIATGITQLLDRATATALVQKGRARLAHFSRDRHVDAVCAVYERCVAERRSARMRPKRPVQPLATVGAEGAER